MKKAVRFTIVSFRNICYGETMTARKSRSDMKAITQQARVKTESYVREGVGRQQIAGSRQQTVDSRQQTADSRQQIADSRQQIADSRQQTHLMMLPGPAFGSATATVIKGSTCMGGGKACRR
jgi:hypothetical protein